MTFARALSAAIPPLIVVVTGVSMARAQGRGSTELGLDAGIAASIFGNDNVADAASAEDVVTVSIPVQSVRVGFFVKDRVEIEPSLGFVLVSSGGERLSQLALGIDVLAALEAEPGAPAPYVTFGGLVTSFDNGHDTATQFGLGGGLGVKFPQGDRWAIRLEGGLARLFENKGEALAAWEITGTIGFSFFAGSR